MRMIHLRLNPRAPLTVCGRDVKDREVLFASLGGFKEIMDGELQEVEACPECATAAKNLETMV